MIDPHSGRAFYQQRATGVRTWSRPEGEEEEEEAPAKGEGTMTGAPPSLEVAAASQAALSTHWHRSNVDGDEPLPSSTTTGAASVPAHNASTGADDTRDSLPSTTARSTAATAAAATVPGSLPPLSLRDAQQSSQGNLNVSQGNLNISQGNLNISQGNLNISGRDSQRRPSRELVTSPRDDARKARQESLMLRIREQEQEDLRNSRGGGGGALVVATGAHTLSNPNPNPGPGPDPGTDTDTDTNPVPDRDRPGGPLRSSQP